ELEGNTVQAETDNGRIELQNIVAKIVKANSSNGRIDMENIEGEVFGKTNNGGILLATNHLNRPIELHSDNGKIEIQSKNKPENAVLDLKTKNGEISVYGKDDWDTVIGDGDNLIKVSSQNGRITIAD